MLCPVSTDLCFISEFCSKYLLPLFLSSSHLYLSLSYTWPMCFCRELNHATPIVSRFFWCVILPVCKTPHNKSIGSVMSLHICECEQSFYPCVRRWGGEQKSTENCILLFWHLIFETQKDWNVGLGGGGGRDLWNAMKWERGPRKNVVCHLYALNGRSQPLKGVTSRFVVACDEPTVAFVFSTSRVLMVTQCAYRPRFESLRTCI